MKLTAQLCLVTSVSLFGLVSACASSRGALDGRFIIEPARSRGDFANDSALVQKADKQITELLGHPVSFHFAAAVVPKWDARLEELSAGAIDAVAHELVEMKRVTPELFAWAAPNLQRVEWDYSAVDEHAHYTFDPSTRTVHIVLTSNECCILQENSIRFAIGRAHATALGARFAGTTSSSVSATDRGAYASWLLGAAYGEEAKAHPPQGDDQTVDRPRAHVLLELLRLRESIQGKDPSLEAKLVAQLVEDASYLAHTRRDSSDVIARLPGDHDFIRAEAAYVAWLEKAEPELADAARVKIAEEIITSTQNDGSVRAFQGFDVVGHYLRIFDAWAKAGAPAKATRDEDRTRQQRFDLIVAPLELRAGEGTSCGTTRSPTYKRIVSDLSARKRVFDAVLTKHDARITKTIMARLITTDVETAIAFWHASESDQTAFQATTRVIAGNVRCSAKSRAFYDALPELWKKYPARRGLIAYAALKFPYASDGNGKAFSATFAPLTSAELTAELTEEDDPLREIPQLWGALGRGWSRMDVLEPRLDRWLEDERYKTDTSWTENVRAVARDLCAEQANADLTRLHGWIGRRVTAHASERGALENASTLSAPGGCPKRETFGDSPAKSPAKKPNVLD